MAGNRTIYDQAMLEANSAAWDQQWDKAIAGYRRALDEFPDDGNALSNLGLTLLATDKLEEALVVYQRAARLNPKEPVAIEKCGELFERIGRTPEAAQTYLAVAELYLSQRDVSKAIANWARAAFLTPDNLQAHSRLALAYERTEKPKEAVAEYLAVARILQKQSESPKALQAAQHAAQLDPRGSEALNAIDMIQRGITLPEPPRPRSGTSLLSALPARGFGAPEEAVKDKTDPARPVKKNNPLEAARRNALSALADMLFDMGEDTPAPVRGKRTTGILKKPGTDMLQDVRTNSRARVLGNLGQAIDLQSNAAAAFYEKALRAGLEHAALRFALGAAYFDSERYGDAIKQFLPATNHRDYDAGAHFGLGLCYGRDSKMKNAVGHLLDSLRLVDLTTVPERQADALSALYETLAENIGRGQNDEQLTRLGEGLIAFLSGPDWQERVAQARQQLNAQQEGGALAALADLLSVPGAERVTESMALIEKYVAQNRLETAMDEAHRAVEHAPTYLPVHIKIAEILTAMQRTEPAVEKYKMVAELYNVRGEAARAGRIYEQLVRLSPLDATVRRRLISLLVSQGRTDEAVNQYIDMAEAHKDLADLESARNTYVEALTLAQGPGGDKARAVQILHMMGDLDLQRLDWRQALRLYEQIKNLEPSDPKARSMLIDINHRLGQSRQALAEADDMLKYFAVAGRLPKAVEVLEELV
ncbi:MAG: tetratricopeptide repeat protein, partial [Chloroflexota bacterium]